MAVCLSVKPSTAPRLWPPQTPSSPGEKSSFLCLKGLPSKLFHCTVSHAPRQAEAWAPHHHCLSIPLLFCFSSGYSVQHLIFGHLAYSIKSLLGGDQNLGCANTGQRQQKNYTLRSSRPSYRHRGVLVFSCFFLKRSLSESTRPTQVFSVPFGQCRF